MTAKRLDIRPKIFAVALTMALPAAASAQLSGGEWHLPAGATSGATTAKQARPQPPVVIVQPQPNYHRPTVFRRSPYHSTTRLPTSAPAVLMPDGTVYADFGRGYEPVSRSCNGGGMVQQQVVTRTVVVGEPTVIGSNGVVLSPARPSYTQPVPNQQTASQQMAARANQTQVVAGSPGSCYNVDGYGRVFVVRY